MNITTKLMNEVIAMPGVGYPITRADCCAAMIDAGHDKATAQMFSFAMARRVQGPPHRNARVAFCCWLDDRPQDGATMLAAA